MKRIIDGLLYDTENENIVKVAEVNSGYHTNDFQYYHDTLYKTQNDRFFLYGTGGAKSKYGNNYGSDLVGGEVIIAFSVGEAFDWMSDNGLIDAIEKYFPDRLIDA